VRLGWGLAGVSAAAWAALALAPHSLVMPGLCAPAGAWIGSAPTRAALALALNPPARLAAGWALMIVAMMSPLLADPLRYVAARSFARRRWRSGALFVAGYGAAWIAAGAPLLATALALCLATPAWLPAWAPALAAAALWQGAPAHQRCLNACHRRPPLAAFGWAADRDALRFGVAQGAACLGACSALMLAALLAGPAHLAAMAAVAALAWAERLERPQTPAWCWRWPMRGARFLLARLRPAASPTRATASGRG
jgi:predicted metal-binding membrane protein